MKKVVSSSFISLLLLTAVAAATPEPGDTPPPPPTVSVVLAGDSIGDGSTPLVILQSGQAGKKVVLTATAPSPTHIILDAQSFPTNIQGVRFTGGTCLASPTCTIEIVIDSDKADVNAPDFPNNQVGALPGTATHQLTVRSSAGDSLVVPFTLEVKSGEVRIKTADTDGNQLNDGSTISVLQKDIALLDVFYMGFPKDDALPDTVTLDATLSPPSKKIIVLGSRLSCTKQELQSGCHDPLQIAATEDAPPGKYTLQFAVDKKVLFTLTIIVGARGLKVTAFTPFHFNKDKSLQGTCAARIDEQVTGPLDQGFSPAFRLVYADKKGAVIQTAPVKGKKTGPGTYTVEYTLPPKNFVSVASATCLTVATINNREYNDAAATTFYEFTPLFFAEDTSGALLCTANVWQEPLQKFGLHAGNLRRVITLVDQNGNPFSDNNKPLFQKIQLGSSSATLAVKKSKLLPFVKENDRVTCRVQLEAYHPTQAKTNPPVASPVTITVEKTISLDQGCETIRHTDFTGPHTIQFIGVGDSQQYYENTINAFISALATDPLYKKYASLFSFKKVRYPWPENIQGKTFEDSLEYIDKRAKKLHKICKGEYSVHLGQFLPGGNGGGHGTFYGRYLTVFVDPTHSQFSMVVRHEAGHMLAKLDDEYSYEDDQKKPATIYSNCLPTKQIISSNLLVCPQWKEYPAYAACLPKCNRNSHFRSTENSLMNKKPGKGEDQFNVIQCAYFTEQLNNLANPQLTIDFDRGMQHCIQNAAAYNLISQQASPAPATEGE